MEDNYELFAKKMAEKYPRYFGEGCHYGGFAIGEGWYHIVESLVHQIDSYTKWKRNTRAHALVNNRVRARGFDAMLKHVMRGNDIEFAKPWQREQAERNMEVDMKVPDRVEYIRVRQIKEKFGGLRFYYDGGDSHISGMVTMAEVWAGYTCEKCGEKGTHRGGGWIRTLCDKHEAEYQAQQAKYESEDGDE